MKKITILGSGWLGLSLAASLKNVYRVTGSYKAEQTKQKLEDASIESLHVDLTQHIPERLFDTDVLCIFVSPSSNKAIPYLDVLAPLLSHPKFTTIQHVIFTSSTSVYVQDTRTKDETHPLKKDHPIALVEQALSIHGNLCILRMAGLMGGGRYLTKYYPSQRVLANALSPVNHIHQTDAVGIIKAVIDQGIQGVYNVCAPLHPTKQAIIQTQCKTLHVTPPTFEQVEGQNGIINSSKLQKATNYTFIYPDPQTFPL